jgi:hypothetical protein
LRTTILAVGLAVERFLPDQGSAVSVPLGPTRGGLEALHDALPSTSTEDSLIAIVPAPWEEALRRRLRAVQLASDREPVAVYSTEAPPLAATVLAALAAGISDHIRSPGLLTAALPAVERELIWLTLLDSVRTLRTPRPTAGQRLASRLPWRRFVVSSWPDVAIHSVREQRPIPPLPELLTEFHLAVAPRSWDGAWAKRVAAGLDNPPTRSYRPTPLGHAWWGTERLVETVAYPVRLSELAEHARRGLVAASCRWCARTIASSPCPFCGHAGGPVRARYDDEKSALVGAVA